MGLTLKNHDRLQIICLAQAHHEAGQKFELLRCHYVVTACLAACSTALFLDGISFTSHDPLLHITEHHDVWVHEEHTNHGTDPVHKQDQAHNGFNTEPDGSDQDKGLSELESTKQAQRAADDTNHKSRNHEAKSFKSRAVHIWGKAGQTEDGKSKGDDVDGNDGSACVTAKATDELEKEEEEREQGVRERYEAMVDRDAPSTPLFLQ